MKNDEAIKIMEALKSPLDALKGTALIEGIDMAIEVLKAQSTLVNDKSSNSQGLVNDLISRQAAIDAILSKPAWHGSDGSYYHTDDIRDAVMQLPSAEPEIIRCKDCKHWNKTAGDDKWMLGDCDFHEAHFVMCDGFCVWAERRTDE